MQLSVARSEPKQRRSRKDGQGGGRDELTMLPNQIRQSLDTHRSLETQPERVYEREREKREERRTVVRVQVEVRGRLTGSGHVRLERPELAISRPCT